MSDYSVSYRPDDFDAVLGQDHITGSLQQVVEKGESQAFLFTGPSGVGKTTLARIVAQRLNCEEQNIREIDGATYNGVADMKQVVESLQYHGLGKSSNRALIVDEAHQLSKPAWQSVLKAIEEPPPGVYWIFCTTESEKVPDTIKTRCAYYQLQSVDTDDLFALVTVVADQEGLQLDESILDLISKEAMGSPRRALKYLSQCAACATRKEAAKVIRAAEAEGDAVIELCRMLTMGRGLSWKNVIKRINALSDQDPESVRLVIVNYMSSAIMNTENPENAAVLLSKLQPFMRPYNRNEKMAPLLLSFGEVLLAGDE